MLGRRDSRSRPVGRCSSVLRKLSALVVTSLVVSGCVTGIPTSETFCLVYSPMPGVFRVLPEAALEAVVDNEIAWEECDG